MNAMAFDVLYLDSGKYDVSDIVSPRKLTRSRTVRNEVNFNEHFEREIEKERMSERKNTYCSCDLLLLGLFTLISFFEILLRQKSGIK